MIVAGNCGLPVKARGLCAKHYLADYRERVAAGEVEKKKPLTFDLEKSGCTVIGCYDKHRAKGLCTKHYFQVRRIK